ncbi:MAG: DMT family transporter [Succinivibrio sp.]
MKKEILLGHIFAITVILFWGLTFVSSKVLLKEFTPVEILFDRFVLATLALLIFAPKALAFISLKVELYSALVGFFGVTLYFVFENNALVYSNASNVCLIVATAPLFCAICDRLFNHGEKLSSAFFLGFIVAITGIACISTGTLKLDLNPLGDLLALGCAIEWGFYVLYISKLHNLKVPMLTVTIKSFFYSVILTVPIMIMDGYSLKWDRIIEPVNAVNFIFLGVFCSSLSFYIWNKAITYIGVVKTNVYIYGTPVVTAVGATLLIDETITVYTILGMVLAIGGLVISQFGKKK